MSDSREPSAAEGKFRPEIEGLRAVAALLVAVFHIWVGRVSGGVDVFFVVSGFLITSGLLAQIQRTGTVAFARFWARLIKRLVPAAFLVLFVVAVASMFFMPLSRWRASIEEVIAAALYFENWVLAHKALDYLERDASASPVQHYWALSLQGQFYLVWPLLLAGAAWVARKSGFATRNATTAMLAAVFVLSLVFSVYLTAVDQPFAYFNTFARAWEFAMGGLLAVYLPRLALPAAARFILGWTGLLAIISCGALLDVTHTFPGYAALWPTLGGAMVMVAGTSGSRFGADRLLGSAPMVYLGGISYGIYLWHFPLLVYFQTVAEPEPLRWWQGVTVLAGSVALAALTARVLEGPARRSAIGATAPLRAFAFGVACAVPALVATAAWTYLYKVENARSPRSVAMQSSQHPGARWKPISEPGTWREAIFPSPLRVDADEDSLRKHCKRRRGEEYPHECSVGELQRPVLRVAVLGGSHSAHWTPALEEIARRDRWQLTSYTRGSCPFYIGEQVPPGEFDECERWNQDVLAEVLRLKPDVVFTTSTRMEDGIEYVPKGYVLGWERLIDAGITVVAIRDNPSYLFDVSACLEVHDTDTSHCTKTRDELGLAERDPALELAARYPSVRFIDLTNEFCDERYCYPVIGNVLVYRHLNHLTATFARTLADPLRQAMYRALSTAPSEAQPAIVSSAPGAAPDA